MSIFGYIWFIVAFWLVTLMAGMQLTAARYTENPEFSQYGTVLFIFSLLIGFFLLISIKV